MKNYKLPDENQKALIKDNKCITVNGNTPGMPCKFPFIYDVYDDFPYLPASIVRWF